jgi:hypothetical protein
MIHNALSRTQFHVFVESLRCQRCGQLVGGPVTVDVHPHGPGRHDSLFGYPVVVHGEMGTQDVVLLNQRADDGTQVTDRLSRWNGEDDLLVEMGAVASQFGQDLPPDPLAVDQGRAGRPSP